MNYIICTSVYLQPWPDQNIYNILVLISLLLSNLDCFHTSNLQLQQWKQQNSFPTENTFYFSATLAMKTPTGKLSKQ